MKHFIAGSLLFVLVVQLSLCSCEHRVPSHYNSLSEAVTDCRLELYRLMSMRSCDLKDLGTILYDWNTRSNAVYDLMKQEKDTSNLNRYTPTFFLLTDSLQREVQRLAFAEKHSLEEVLSLQLNSRLTKSEKTKSNLYKSVSSFFGSLDKRNIIDDPKRVVADYLNLFETTDSIKIESDFLNFLSREDYCFRALLNHIAEISDDDLAKLTQLTDDFLYSFAKSVREYSSQEQCDRINMYLQMRLNRRIIQNAMACRNYVYKGGKIEPDLVMRFWWMIAEPFLSIKEESFELLTPKQIKDLKLLCMECPGLLNKIYKSANITVGEDERKAIIEALTEYSLSAYLSSYFTNVYF